MKDQNTSAMPNEIAAAFEQFPEGARNGLLKLRALILAEAESLPEIGPIQEVMRWGQPSYITPKKKAASTLRLGVPKHATFGIFAHCQSTIISDFVSAFPNQDRVDGNRALLFDSLSDVEPSRHRLLIRAALTYHL